MLSQQQRKSILVFLSCCFLNSCGVVSSSGIDGVTCYDLPVVIVSPETNFPAADCKPPADHLPHQNCMKAPVASFISVLNEDTNNCVYYNGTTTKSTAFDAVAHYRGDSSLHFDSKHQLTISLNESSDTTSFLNFPTGGHTFVLNGPWIDGSMMRNHLAHWLFRGTSRWSPRTRHVIIYIKSGSSLEYHGIYLVLEKISHDTNRLALSENSYQCTDNGGKNSGGWIWQYNPLSYGVTSPNGVMDKYQAAFGAGERPILEYPKSNDLSSVMRNAFISLDTGPLPRFHKFLYENMTAASEDLEQHIDIGSFVDYLLHTELSLNQDAYTRSTWFFKDKNEPINAGPVWDYNLAYGLGSAAKKSNSSWLFENSQMWKRLRCNYKVAALMIARWKALRANSWSDLRIKNFVASSSAPITAQLAKCGKEGGQWASGNLSCALVSSTGGLSYEAELASLVKSVLDRAAWIDRNIIKATAYGLPLNATICGTGGPLPKYNCEESGMDNGCIENPEPYYTAIEFPEVRQSKAVTPCDVSNFIKSNLTLPSKDPCWESVGVSVTESFFTPFCSGFGACPQGIGAVCKCNNNAKTFDCSVKAASKFSESWFFYVAGVLLVISLVCGAHSICYKRRNTEDAQYLKVQTNSEYGSTKA